MSRYLTMLCGFLFALSLYAQDNQKEINNIKKSKHYVYASATSTTSKEEAAQSAKDLLLLEVEQWLKDEKKDDVVGYVVKVKNSSLQIETQRGKLYRVFAYVAKKNVLPFYKDEEIESVRKDTVKTEQQNTPVAATPKVEQLAVAKPTLTPEEEKMVKIDQFDDLNAYVAGLKASGAISDYGKYATMPKDSDIYLFVYNTQGEICAKIKRFSSESLNMSTWKKDDVTNYKKCGAIWIKMKEQ